MINAEYPVSVSSELINKAKEKIASLKLENNIMLKTDYLSDEACLSELAEADLIVFPYQETGESSSAAVRYGIASGTPVAVTPLKIFDDVAPAAFKLSGTTPMAMANSLIYLMTEIQKNSQTVQIQKKSTQRWSNMHSFDHLGKQLYYMSQVLHHRSLSK